MKNLLLNTFFNTALNTFKTAGQAQQFREQLDAINTKYYGNPLKKSKLFLYFADLLGTKNANQLTETLNEKIGTYDTDLSLQERINIATELAGFKAQQDGWSNSNFGRKNTSCQLFYRPIFDVTMLNDNEETTMTIYLFLYVDTTNSRTGKSHKVTLNACLGFGNDDIGVNDFNTGFSLSESVGSLFAYFNEFDLNHGKMTAIKETSDTISMLGCRGAIDNQNVFWSLCSGKLLSVLTESFQGLLNGDDLRVTSTPDAEPEGAFSDGYYNTFFTLTFSSLESAR